MSGVCVAWVHSHTVSYSWFSTMLNLQGWLFANGHEGRWMGQPYSSSGISVARNNLVKRFMQTDDEWLFWVDTDMGFDPESVGLLLDVADPDTRPVVGGLCFSLQDTGLDGLGGFTQSPIPTIYKWAEQPNGVTGFVSWHDYPRNELFECDSTGSAFILIHRTVLEKIRDVDGENWYGHALDPNGSVMGEDMSFCVRLMKVGVQLAVHTGAETNHHKDTWISQATFDLYRDAYEQRGTNSQIESGGAKLVPIDDTPRNRAERRRARRQAS